jgi:hypothetical protein
MRTETNKALAERVGAILDTGDLGQFDELCSPGMVKYLPAEVRCRLTMRSTGEPVEGAMIRCPTGRWFDGPIESLTWESSQKPAPGPGGNHPSARPDYRPGRHEGRADGGRLAVPYPREPEREARRPNGAPAYYLGRPAHIYITAMRPSRRHAASDHPEQVVAGDRERPPSRHGHPLSGPGAGTARMTPATTSLPVIAKHILDSTP